MSEASVEALAARIVGAEDSERERAYLIYRWVAGHIEYDAQLFLSGRTLSATTPEEVLETRRGLCNGFALLYQALAGAVGLESVVIEGWAKGIGAEPGQRFREPNHAWNAVRIDDRWALVDATWAAGHIAHGEFVRRVTDDWFDVDPLRLRFTHHPKRGTWQLAHRRISRRAFEALPMARPEMFQLGVDPAALAEEARKQRVRQLPDAFPIESHRVRIRDVPLSRWLQAGQRYRFRFDAERGEAAFISQAGKRYGLEPGANAGEFVGEFEPANGTLTLFVSFADEPDRWHPVLSYQAL